MPSRPPQPQTSAPTEQPATLPQDAGAGDWLLRLQACHDGSTRWRAEASGSGGARRRFASIAERVRWLTRLDTGADSGIR